MSEIKKLGILTSGGDCCGLNAVIESVVRTATTKNYQVIGYKMGYDGLYNNDFIELNNENVRDIGRRGGSIIGNSNKTNLFNHYKEVNGVVTYSDDSDIAIANMKKEHVDVLIVVGGDGSMTSARDFMRKGVNVICIPKTIDNDVPYTDKSFGYSTAVFHIADALESVRTTGASHDRVMILEVMGRHAGWLALEGGLAGDADFILLPEVPYDIKKIIEELVKRYKAGFKSTVICVSEGSTPKDGEVTAVINKKYPDAIKLGGIGAKLAVQLQEELAPLTGQEVRSTNLGYIQRGGETNSVDKILSFRYGSYAVEAISKGDFGKMVSLRGEELFTVPITEVVGNGPTGETSKGGRKNVNPDSDLLRCARSMGVFLGD